MLVVKLATVTPSKVDFVTSYNASSALADGQVQSYHHPSVSGSPVWEDEPRQYPSREEAEALIAEGFPHSILTHVLKSLPNGDLPGESRQLRKKLGAAEAHVAEARQFLPFVAGRDPKRAEKLSTCGSWLLFHNYLVSLDCRLASGIFCRQPLLCGFCAAGRAGRQVQALAEKFSTLVAAHPHLRPYMVTLTMRGRPELRGMMDDFWSAWGRMVRRRRNSLAGKSKTVMGLMNGGFLAGEAKRGQGGRWHYHAHGVFLSDAIDRYVPVWESLKREWSKEVGQESASIQFEPVKDSGTVDAIREACKYASKWEPGNYADRWEAFQAHTLDASGLSRRLTRVRCFGVLRGVELPEDVVDDLSDKHAEEFVEMAFRYGQSGYYEVPLPKPFEEFLEYAE